MRLTIFAKMALMLVLSIVFVVLPVLYTVYSTISGSITQSQRSTMNLSANVIQTKLRAYEDSIRILLVQSTKRVDFAKAVAEKNVSVLAPMLKEMEMSSAIDMVTLSDANGNVIMRSHSDSKGDSVSGQLNVRRSQEGRPLTVGFEGGSAVKFSLRGGAPIIYEGQLVGVLTPGIRLDLLSTVDQYKKDLGVEVTFFKENTRIATSLMDKDGKRMVGTTMDNKAVLDTVLEKGDRFISDRIILGGKPYSTLYTPLKDADGKNIGMLFLGSPSEDLESMLTQLMTNIAFIALGLAAIMGFCGIVTARMSITKPLHKVSGVISDLVDDRAEMSLRLDTSKGDEVAQLSHQVNRLIDKVGSMLANITGFKNMVNAIPDPVFAVDSRYQVVLANARVCELAGVKSPEALHGKHINDVLNTTIYSSATCPLRKTMADKTKTMSEVFELHMGGRLSYVRGLGDVIRDAQGNELGFIQVVSDVTDTVEHEKLQTAQMERMENINRQVSAIAGQVNDSASHIQVQTGNVRQAADQQSALMQDTLQAVAQMNDTIAHIAQSASIASTRAGEGRQTAIEGESIVRQAMQAIDSVRLQTEELNKNLGVLGEQADGIGQVLNVISDIADQTNLLALNAAIEAARAGEAGRGFAVVADEVRKLAEKTMTATQEVRKAVEDIQAGANTNITGMQEVAVAVVKATEMSRSSEAALGEIVQLVTDSSNQVSGIAASAEQQSAASEQIAGSVTQVTAMAEQSAQQSRESAQTAEQLSSFARELHNIVQ